MAFSNKKNRSQRYLYAIKYLKMFKPKYFYILIKILIQKWQFFKLNTYYSVCMQVSKYFY